VANPAVWIFARVKARQIKNHDHFGVDRMFLAIVVRHPIPKAIIYDMSQMT
jgi:predicted regulator of amino acid metabolism with ACT domain